MEDDFDVMQKFMREINIKFTETQTRLNKSIEANQSKIAALKNSGDLAANTEVMQSIPPEVIEMLSKTQERIKKAQDDIISINHSLESDHYNIK